VQGTAELNSSVFDEMNEMLSLAKRRHQWNYFVAQKAH